jgi:outer membrane protein assembly factor BamE (lipoprotein component of BamABCDE complex)
MQKRTYLFAISMIAVLGAIGLSYWLFRSREPSAITRENALKIKPGMTLKEVEKILGGPARFDYDGVVTSEGATFDQEDRKAVRRLQQPVPKTAVRTLRWGSGTITIDIHFDAEGRCLPFGYMLHQPAPETLIEMIRRKLGLE